MSIIAPRRPVPPQDQHRILLHANRFRRASDALAQWSENAKKCVDYVEGRQWGQADLEKLAREKRPALTLNMIRRLVNLVLGYHINNRTDIAYKPGFDGLGTSETAAVLTHVAKQIAEANQQAYVDTEVFMDGIITGRGFYDMRLDFRKNTLGAVKCRAQDPFSTYLDPDADAYDLNEGAFIMASRWTSYEEVQFFYGKTIAEMIGPFMQAGGVSSGMPMSSSDVVSETTPVRAFGLEEGDKTFSTYFYDFLDATRKAIRLLEIQHYVLCERWFFVDLETGDKRAVPDSWGPEKTKKTLTWARDVMRQPLVVQRQATRRLRQTHMIGDVIAYDDWSPYDSFTIVPFFPYFRRGVTQGMVEHLLDAQDEKNKRRSVRLNILGRSSNGGWMYPRGSLDAQQKDNLERNGGSPGFNLEYDSKEGTLSAPSQIQVATTPASFAQLEKDAEDDMMKIAGINDAAMGELDAAAASGRSIERRQRQAIMGQELFTANFQRSKELLGGRQLEIVQNHYTEERVIRTTGPGRTMIEKVINQRTAAGVVNDVTLGSYAIAIDETPLSKSFLEAQFEELMELKGMGVPIPDDFIIDATSVARKEELKLAVAMARQAEAQQAAAAAAAQPPGGGKGPPGGQGGSAPAPAGQDAPGPGPGGSRVGRDGGSLPAGPEPGAPAPI
ncbi:portal protein [Falsiroseomonas tokyonensis]|uniref:Portal protein n=1 Tax=Falsiroseomonas tokyonensis TaxID=430521 RepID=A0ABV7BX03_9PROT|nr:hypothetical protein [Falsiroseomonas tokyonensis]MBU8540188.1 hypothetical protein [Falsiroseomonas tokyonensis]